MSPVWAQTVYRIVGSDGRVVYADRPLGPDAQVVNLQAPSGSGDNALPYALREVAKQFPVTLFSSADCPPCDAGRNFLRRRGIPFAERTVSTQADIDALVKQLSTNTVPALQIGGQLLKGFLESQWAQYLDAAGYPSSSMLPAQYRAPAPAPLATPAPVVAAPKEAVADPAGAASAPKPASAPQPPRVNPDNPAGIRF